MLRLAREGCIIAVADIDYEAAQKTVQEIRQMNGVAYAYKVCSRFTSFVKREYLIKRLIVSRAG